MQRQRLCREIVMGLLTRQDVAAYLDLEFVRHELPAEFTEFLYQRTEGNPLFVTDTLRHLRAEGAIREESGCWRLARPLQAVEQRLPESVRSMIERRLAQLDEPETALLAVAAVQGQEFDSRITADVLGLDAAEVEERLGRLERVNSFVRLLHDQDLPDGSLSLTYAFAHVLYQHAILDGLAPSRKAALSKEVANAIIRHHGDAAASVASQIALLLETARDFERASDYFIAAAANASRMFANEEAVSLSNKAIACAERLHGPARYARVLAAALQVAQLELLLSRFEDATRDFEKAERAAEALGDVDAQVNAICAGALAQFNQKRMEVTREYAGRALAIAQAAGSELGVASAELVAGLERLCYGATTVAEESFGRSVPVLRRLGPPVHALEAVGFAGLLHVWQLEHGTAHHAVNWTLQRARDLGLPYHIVMNLFVRGMANFNQGRLSDGLNDLREGLRLAEKNRERYWLSRFPNTLGWVHRELQDFETALKLDSEGAVTARENGYGKPEAFSNLNLAHDYMALGEPHRALAHLHRAEEIVEADGWFRWRYNIRLKAELARYWLLRGDPVQARGFANESLALAEPRKARKHIAGARKILGDIAVAEERFDEAAREYDAALELLRSHSCPVIEWTVLLAAAEMASAQHDAALAERYRARCRGVIRSLADSITDDRLQRRFVSSEAVRKALM
jgi:tetratricopeptide (TPR) repeat protein